MSNGQNNNNNNNDDELENYIRNALPDINEYMENNTFEKDNFTNNFKDDFSFTNKGNINKTADDKIDITTKIHNKMFMAWFEIQSPVKINYVMFEPWYVYSEEFFNLKKDYINQVNILNDIDTNINDNDTDNIKESDFFKNINGYEITERKTRLEDREKNSNNKDSHILVFGLIDKNDTIIEDTILYTKCNFDKKIENTIFGKKIDSANITPIDATTENENNNTSNQNSSPRSSSPSSPSKKARFKFKRPEHYIAKISQSTYNAFDYLYNKIRKPKNSNNDTTGGKRTHKKTKKINTRSYRKSKKSKK